jgi:hypothetical protein
VETRIIVSPLVPDCIDWLNRSVILLHKSRPLKILTLVQNLLEINARSLILVAFPREIPKQQASQVTCFEAVHTVRSLASFRITCLASCSQWIRHNIRLKCTKFCVYIHVCFWFTVLHKHLRQSSVTPWLRKHFQKRGCCFVLSQKSVNCKRFSWWSVWRSLSSNQKHGRLGDMLQSWRKQDSASTVVTLY